MVIAAALFFLLASPDFDKVDFGTTAARRVRLLRHKNPAVRRRAARLLAHADADEAIAALLIALRDPKPTVRAAVAKALQSLKDERAVPGLAERARVEVAPNALTAVLVALGRCGGPYVARHVVPFLEHPARAVRAAAAASLGHIGDPGQRGALWSALRYAPDDPGFVVRSAVLSAFVNLGWKKDVRRAIEELTEQGALRHWLSRAAILTAIGAAGLKEEEEWVRREIVTAGDPRIVAAAAGALARLGGRDAAYELLGHSSPLVRRAALVSLQEVGDPRALARALVMVREDKDINVRFEAALVLSHGRHPDADIYLVDALRSRDPLYWVSALSALEQKYGRSFGRDPEAWSEFFKKNSTNQHSKG